MVEVGQPIANESSVKKKKKNRGVVTACTSATKYELVRRCIGAIGMTCLPDEDANSHAYLIWYDSVVQPDRVQELKSYQHINHFPGMAEICRKDYLARNMAKMSRARPNEYHFIPRTWILPSEYNLLVLYWKDLKKKHRKPQTFIMKPANGAMGNGIQLFRNPENLVPHEHMVVQEYLDRPFLLDDFKIDLRLYVLVTHCDPLRAFIYHDGLVRLGTEKYASPSESNVDSLFMHLTNYSVNKYNQNFERHADFDRGSKRSVKSLLNYLQSVGVDTTTLWRNIIDLVVKTLIVVCPYILHSYRMSRPGQPPHADSVCFEILGFDIFLDRKLKPWLLEVNRSPSFGADEDVDKDIKSGVVKDALKLLNIRASDKSRNLAQQKADTRRRLLKPTNKHLSMRSGLSDAAKRRMVLNRRKEELKERLSWARKHAAREEYENKNMNNYIRIFPSCEKRQQEKYLDLLQESFSLFLQSRSAPFHRNIIDQFRQQREDEILDLLEQCEAEELGGNGRSRQQVQTLSSMPELLPPSSKSYARGHRSPSCDSSDSTSSSASEDELKSKNKHGKGKLHAMSKLSPEAEKATRLVHLSYKKSIPSTSPARPRSAGMRQFSASKSPIPTRPSTSHGGYMQDKKKRMVSSSHQRLQINATGSDHQGSKLADGGPSALVDAYISSYSEAGRRINQSTRRGRTTTRVGLGSFTAEATQEREVELNARLLIALHNTRIKFPGKTDDEAERILDNIMDNWKLHKPHVASYWLIKLDTSKRQKVIDIVRGNVRAVVQRTWITSDVDTLKTMRTFNRVFNRMHANHGQGLWSCFSASGNTWETMFSKSSEKLSESELNCCRRIVQLCKECLLIVYQFANDARTAPVTISHQSGEGKLRLTHPPIGRINPSHMLLPHNTPRGVHFKAFTTFSKAESDDQKSDHFALVAPSHAGIGPLSLTNNRESLARNEYSFLSRTRSVAAPIQEAELDTKLEEKRPSASLSLDNLPRRFMKSTSLYGPSSSRLLTTNYPRLQTSTNGERGNLLASFQRSKTDTGIKT